MNGIIKKALSFFLTATLLITSGLSLASATETDDGYTLITTAAELNAIRENIDENGKIYGKYRLGANIVFNQGETFQPIGKAAQNPFIGELDGNGYTIKNLTLKADEQSYTTLYLGLFAYNNGTIKNLILDNVSLEITKCSYLYAGTIAGAMVNTGSRGKVINCYVKGSVNVNKTTKASATWLGGVAGKVLGGQVNKTVSDMNINYVCSDIENIYIGGIAAESSGKIIGCGNVGDIYALSENESVVAGGIVGNLISTTSAIQDCYNVGDITGESARTLCLGGIAGAMGANNYATKLLYNCNTGKITPKANFLGDGYTSGMATIASGAIIGNFNGESNSNFYLKGTYSVAATNPNISNKTGKSLNATEKEYVEEIRSQEALNKLTTWYLPTDTSLIPQLQAWKNIKDYKFTFAREVDEKHNAIIATNPVEFSVEYDDGTFATETKAVCSKIELGENDLTVSLRGVEKQFQYLGYIPGDVNFDAYVTVTDITTTIQAITNAEELGSGVVPADMDSNELVTVTDVVEIRKVILQK